MVGRITILQLLPFFLFWNLNGQTVIEEVKLDNGKLINVYDNGTWKEIESGKPTIEWVYISAGSFTMGSPSSEVDRRSDEVQHKVELSAFKMSKYEVTFAQYDIFCEATGRIKPDDNCMGRGNRPVINVSWYDALAFAEWMGCRLPTENEWEYACRAGTSTAFNTGTNLFSSDANYNGLHPYIGEEKGTFKNKTMPVGKYSPNAWGLYDMHGNVWEWCSSWYIDYMSEVKENADNSAANIVGRGGAWNSEPKYCRSAYRNNINPKHGYKNVGFRLVVSSKH